MDDDDALTAAQPPLTVRAAAALTALAGLFVALTGAQLLGVRWMSDWRNLGAPFFLGLGVLLIPLATSIYRGRASAMVAAFVFAALGSLTTLGWFITTLPSIVSLMNMVAIPMSTVAAVLAGLSIPAARKMTDARERLADAGLDLGL